MSLLCSASQIFGLSQSHLAKLPAGYMLPNKYFLVYHHGCIFHTHTQPLDTTRSPLRQTSDRRLHYVACAQVPLQSPYQLTSLTLSSSFKLTHHRHGTMKKVCSWHSQVTTQTLGCNLLHIHFTCVKRCIIC